MNLLHTSKIFKLISANFLKVLKLFSKFLSISPKAYPDTKLKDMVH